MLRKAQEKGRLRPSKGCNGSVQYWRNRPHTAPQRDTLANRLLRRFLRERAQDKLQEPRWQRFSARHRCRLPVPFRVRLAWAQAHPP